MKTFLPLPAGPMGPQGPQGPPGPPGSGAVSSVANSDGTLTISPTTANVVASLNLGHANTWTKSQNVASFALTDGATISTDASQANVFTVTLAGNRTLANPTNLIAGGTYQWIVSQDATGSRTLAYGTAFTWANAAAPTLSTAANAVDVITATYDGTKLRCVFSGNFQ